MQNDVIAKIDALLKMSESSSNLSTMNVELREIDCEIKETKLELKELKATISDEKYFDASGEIVDKNIEISLTKKIKSLNKSLNDINEQLGEVQLEEESAYKNIEKLEQNIKSSEEYVDVLKTKINSANSDNVAIFKPLLKEEESKLKADKKYLDKQSKAYEKIQNKISLLSYSKKELEDKIKSEKEKLEDIKANLLNKRSYVNSELKKEDEAKLAILEDKIKKLESSKNEMMKDPVMIAEAAKNFLLDDDKTSALAKIKELKDIINELPYMSIDDYSGKETLEIELENAESRRDEFASMINSKNYESVDATLIKDKIAYNSDKIDRFNKIIEETRNKINENDSVLLNDLNNRINYCESEVETLRDKIEEYAKTLEETVANNNKRSSLQASFDKKQEELNNVLELLNQYKADRQELVLESFDLENNVIKKYEDLIAEIEKQNKALEKLCIAANKVKDVIAIENDKKTLKELTDKVKSIKKRQTFKNTPDEIYDEIEIILGTDKSDDFELIEDEDIDFDLSMPSIDIDEIENINEPEEVFEQDSITDDVIDEENSSDVLDFTDFVDLDEVEEPVFEENEEQTESVNDELDEVEEIDIPELNFEDIDFDQFIDEDVQEDSEEQNSVEKVENDNSEKEEELLNSLENLEPLDLDEYEMDDILDIDALPIVDEDELDMPLDDIEEEKIKVVNVEELDDISETDDNSEFLIGDYNSEV